MASIEYKIHDGSVIIDEEDLGKVSSKKWYVVGKSVRSSTGVRSSHLVAGKPAPGLVAAHWDGNFRNNQKDNIRHVTQQVNMARDFRHTKGYYWDKSRNLWMVCIGVGGRRINGGRFASEELAAEAAHRLRLKLQGEACK